MELTHESSITARVQALEIVVNQLVMGLIANPGTRDLGEQVRRTVLEFVMDTNDRLERDDHTAEFRMRYGAAVLKAAQKLLR